MEQLRLPEIKPFILRIVCVLQPGDRLERVLGERQNSGVLYLLHISHRYIYENSSAAAIGDAQDLKSCEGFPREGSSPSPGTIESIGYRDSSNLHPSP